jgi:hypothetical protein
MPKNRSYTNDRTAFHSHSKTLIHSSFPSSKKSPNSDLERPMAKHRPHEFSILRATSTIRVHKFRETSSPCEPFVFNGKGWTPKLYYCFFNKGSQKSASYLILGTCPCVTTEVIFLYKTYIRNDKHHCYMQNLYGKYYQYRKDNSMYYYCWPRASRDYVSRPRLASDES